jgi:signal transduction histidine kinase
VAEKSPANGGDGRRGIQPKYFVLDGIAGLVLGALLIRSAMTPEVHHPVHAPLSLGIAASVASASSVALRRLAPLPALTVALAACTLSYLGGFQRDPYIAVGLVMYVVATTKPRYVSISALMGVAAVVVLTFGVAPVAYVIQKSATARTEHLVSLAQSITPLAVVCAAWALGFAVRRQRAYIAAVRAQAQDQVRAQRELAWRAVTEERLRIARELHDVVAHGMSVITVQAGVGRHVIDEQPEQARAALAVIESTGRESLREMRRLLGILREDGRDTERTPAPSIADIDDLIGRLSQAGTTVDLDIRGQPRVLPGVVELSAYRIVQEALTNVVKHARTDRCRISLAYAPDTLGIEVTDDGVGAQPASEGFGHGLIGMRERTALHGGRFEAGPLPLRGYRVAASLPLEDAGAEA